MQLTGAGFSEKQTEALFEVYGNERTSVTQADLEPLASKADLERFATKEDLERFATKPDLERFATKADLERFATKADLERFATKSELQALELRLTLRFGGMAAAGVAILAVVERL